MQCRWPRGPPGESIQRAGGIGESQADSQPPAHIIVQIVGICCEGTSRLEIQTGAQLADERNRRVEQVCGRGRVAVFVPLASGLEALEHPVHEPPRQAVRVDRRQSAAGGERAVGDRSVDLES